MKAGTSTPPAGYRSGWCGASWHERCAGVYGGTDCCCSCHAEPEPEPRRVQVRRSEVWRTDPDGSCRVIGMADREPGVPEDDAVRALLAQLDIDPTEYGPPWP